MAEAHLCQWWICVKDEESGLMRPERPCGEPAHNHRRVRVGKYATVDWYENWYCGEHVKLADS